MSEREALTSPTRPTHFTVIDANTNETLRAGTCQYASLPDQSTSPNEIVVEGHFPDNMYRFEMTAFGPVAIPIGEHDGR